MIVGLSVFYYLVELDYSYQTKVANEARSFGKAQPDTACVDGAFAMFEKKYKSSQYPMPDHFLRACLEVARPTDEFCVGVPVAPITQCSDQYVACRPELTEESKVWRRQRMHELGDVDNREGHEAILREIQQQCQRRRHLRAKREAVDEARSFGHGQPDTACLQEANKRFRQPYWEEDISAASQYLETCLEIATKTDGFCDGVPSSRSWEENEALWAQHFTLLRADIGDLVHFRNDLDVSNFRVSYYNVFLSVIQDHCVHRRAKE